MLEIRPAQPEESETIARILRESFGRFESDYTPEAMQAVTPSPDEVVTRFDEGPIWVAVDEDEIVGTVSVVPEPEWLYIRSMAVSPKAQGLGIGNKMLQEAERYAADKGFDMLFLYTTYFSASAIKLYEKNGFYKVRDTTAEEWFGTPGLAMEKKIDRNTKQNVVGS